LHKELYSGSQDCLIKAWDAQTGQLLRKQSGHGGWITDLLFVPELRLLFSCSIDHTIRVWSDKGKQAQVPSQTRFIHLMKMLHKIASTPSGLAAAPPSPPTKAVNIRSPADLTGSSSFIRTDSLH